MFAQHLLSLQPYILAEGLYSSTKLQEVFALEVNSELDLLAYKICLQENNPLLDIGILDLTTWYHDLHSI